MSFALQNTDLSETLPPARARKYPFHEMEPGMMFFVPGPSPKPNTVMSLASATGKRLGVTFMTRQLHMKNVGGVWEQCQEKDKGAVRGVAVIRTA
jgi:hypothetical protein